METITYQGEKLAVTSVQLSSGDFDYALGCSHQGEEEVVRDAAGRYYLCRRLQLLDVHTPRERRASGRLLVHRLSLAAAALWAVARSGPLAADLRQELSAALAKLPAAGAVAAPPHARILVPGSASDPADATTISYQGRKIPTTIIGEIESYYSDATDSLLRDEEGFYYLRRCQEPGDSNAHFPNGMDLVHRISLSAAILWAINELGNGDSFHLRQDAVPVLKAPSTLSATHEYADGGMDITLRLRPGPARLVRAVAEVEGDTPLGVVYEGLRVYTAGGLAYRGRDWEQKMEAIFLDNAPEEEEPALTVHVTGWEPFALENDLAEALRLRAARQGVDPATTMLDVVRGHFQPPAAAHPSAVQADESGEVTVPLLLTRALYRQVLAMGAYDGRGNFNDTAENCLAAEVQSWLDTDDPRPTPREFLASYEEQLDAGLHPLVWPPTPIAPSSTLDLAESLDEEAAALVRRYLEVSPWAFEAADVINGAVIAALQMAFDNQEEAVRKTGLDHPGRYHDGGWGIMQERFDEAHARRTGAATQLREEEEEPDDDEAEINAAVARMQAKLGAPGRASVHDPEDVALLAAAAPEAIVPGSLADLVSRRDAILREMAQAEQGQGDAEPHSSSRLAELEHLNRRIHALEAGEQGKEGK